MCNLGLMTAALDLSLGGLIRQVIASNPDETDARELAKLVARATPEEQLLDFYANALAPMVRITIGSGRNAALAGVRRGRSVSKRMAHISADNWWQKALEERLSIEGRYIPFGDCTADDIKVYAESLRISAEAMQTKAERYDRVLNAMVLQGVATVRDLNGPIE